MKEKRVLLVGPFLPAIGGDSVSTSNLARSAYWAERGFAITRLNTSAGGRIRLPGERYRASDMPRALRIFARLFALLPRTDLLMLWTNGSFLCTAGIAILRLARLFGKPYVVKPFGTGLPDVLGRTGALRRRLVAASLERAELVLLQTRELHEWGLKEFEAGRAEIMLFPNFIPDRYLHPLSACRPPSGSCTFMGQIKREKGVFDIIEAIGGRAGVRCDFYGPIAERDRELFLSAIAASDRCSYEGIARPDDIMDTMSRYDILLLPTYHAGEGYPAVILEAYAAGLPVITSRWRSIPDIVEDGVTGLIVPPASPAELGRAIDRLLGDPGLYSAIREGAHGAAQSFSEKRIVGEILIPRLAKMWEG